MNHGYRTAGIGVIEDKFVFAVGGVDNNSSKSVNMLNLSSQSPCWISVYDMLVSREYLGVGVIDNCLYAVSLTIYLFITFLYYKYKC